MTLEHLCQITPVVALLSFEHLKTTIGIIYRQYFSRCTFPVLYILFSLSTPSTLFFHIFVYVYLYWRVIILQNL